MIANLHELAARHKYGELRFVVVLITGECVLDVEGSTGNMTCTVEWTVLQWRRRRRLVWLIQRTQLWTFLCLPECFVWRHSNRVQTWRHWIHHCQQQQQRQKHWNHYDVHFHLLLSYAPKHSHEMLLIQWVRSSSAKRKVLAELWSSDLRQSSE